MLKFYHIKYLSFFLFFIGLYFGGRYCINTLALFVIISIIELFKEGVRPIKEFPRLLWLPIGFYLIHIISSFYSTNQVEAQFDLEVKSSFLILPILFGLRKTETESRFFNVFRIFVHTTSISMFILLGINISRYFKDGVFLFYNDYSNMLHPSYLSMYLIFNILVIAFLFINKKEKTIYLIPSIFISLTTLLIAESKAGQLTALILIIFIAFHIIPTKYKRLAIMASIVLVFIFGFIAKDSKRFHFFINAFEQYSNIKEHPETVKESTALRILAWTASFNIIKRNPIIGVGNGDIKDELSKVYVKRNYTKPLEMHMNAHNQYLETFIGQGIIGLSILLIMLFSPFIVFRKQSILYQGFILIVVLNLLVESMFNTQAGVIFILFFYSYLFSQSKTIRPSVQVPQLINIK